MKKITLEYGKARRGHRDKRGTFRAFGSNGPIGWTDVALAPGPGVVLGRKGAYRGVELGYAGPADSCSVVHVRAGEDRDGSVALDDGVYLIGGARDLLLAAACSLWNRSAVYQPGSPPDHFTTPTDRCRQSP